MAGEVEILDSAGQPIREVVEEVLEAGAKTGSKANRAAGALSKTRGLLGGGLGLLAAFLGPAIIQGFKSGRTRVDILKEFLDNPELLQAEFDKQTKEGDFQKLVEEQNLRKLAAIAQTQPQLMDTLRALQTGQQQPRLTGSEIRIGGPNDFEAIDKLIAGSDLFDDL